MGVKLRMQPMNRYSKSRMLRELPGGLLHRSVRFWLFLGLLLLSLLISGCVRSDLEINFKGQAGGEVVQHIKLAEQLTAVNGSTVQSWFARIERQARQLRGRSKRLSNQEIEITIPFGNATDLETKLNQFLNAAEFKDPGQPANSAAKSLPLTPSHLRINQQNFLLLFRSHLIYDLDLRSLGVQSLNGNLLLSPDALLDLEFSLNTPWGARSAKVTSADPTVTSPVVKKQGQTLTWTLQPGQLNHLEAFFWYPSPIGLGAIGIALLVLAGLSVKYGPSLGKSPTPELPGP